MSASVDRPARDLSYELAFWGDCLNTWDEERKHLVYAPLMGITLDLGGRRVVDIGGGPVSMLLKCANRGRGCDVVDPLVYEFPNWVRARYRENDIRPVDLRGERFDSIARYDEAWLYNVLQHVDDPELVVANARRAAGVVRVFEWIDIPAYEGHPHELRQADLERWFGGPGGITDLAGDGCYGRAFHGAFA